MNEYEVVTKKGKGYVYADDYKIFPATYTRNRTAQFYKNGLICHTAFDVVSVVLVP